MEKIDATIGKSIRHYRWLQGLSQADLASALGISDAQMRSFEAGKSRVSAARLSEIAGHLGVELSAFFKRSPDHADPIARPDPIALRGDADSLQSGKYLAILMTHFQRLNDSQKQAVLQLVVSISKQSAQPLAVPCPEEQHAAQVPAQPRQFEVASTQPILARRRDGSD